MTAYLEHQPGALHRSRMGLCKQASIALPGRQLTMKLHLQGEQKGSFVARVQSVIAEELGIPISDITIQRKREVVKLARKLDDM